MSGNRGILSVLWKPNVLSVRYRRVNVQRPRAPHYERALVLELVKPLYAKPPELSLPPALKCLRNQEIEETKYRPENPYERIVAKEILCRFNKSRMVALFHTNPIAGEDKFQAIKKFRMEKMYLGVYSRFTMDMALKDTRYEAVLTLFKCHNAIVFCDEPQVAKLLKIVKKIPQFVLMAGVVEGQLLSVSQLNAYSEVGSLEQARTGLVAALQAAACNTVSTLQSGPSSLVQALEQHAHHIQESQPS